MRSNFNRAGILGVALLAAWLAACGGGSGGSSNPASVATLTVSPTVISVQVAVNQQDATANVNLTVSSLALDAKAYITSANTTSGIDHLAVNGDGTTQLQLVINFRSPYQTAPGTYHDTLTLHACLETPCVHEISGSPKTVSTTYTVVPLSGPPTLSLQQNSVSWNGFLMDPMAPAVPGVQVTFPNMPVSSVPFVFLSNTGNTIFRTSYRPSGFGSTAAGLVEFELKTAPTLGVGSFTDTVTLRACLDANCASELAGSPATINVHYAVSDTQSGAGYRERGIPLKANDLVWDATRQVIYVAMASDAPANANTIGVLDPVSGQFLSYVPTGSNPWRLEVSPDGQYLYVGLHGAGQIQRLALATMTLDATLQLGRIGTFPLYAQEMHVSPASSRTLGVIEATDGSQPVDLVVFDDDVKRPGGVGGSYGATQISTFQWASGTRIFGVDGYSTSGQVSHIDVDASGLHVTAIQPEVVNFDGAAYLLGGRMYTQKGRIFDPETYTQLGMFPFTLTGTTRSLLTLDAAQGKAFFTLADAIQPYDLSTRAALPSIPVLRAGPSAVSRMISWGDHGLALLNYETPGVAVPGILLIDGTLVHP